MPQVIPFATHLAPDSVRRLEQAAAHRYNEAMALLGRGHRLTAMYLMGYSVEMCLTAAYFRRTGFSPNAPIDRDTRQRRMALARQLRSSLGQPLMSGDPHPLAGWARLLRWQRSASDQLTARESQRLNDAVRKAEIVYKHWRPELRYKTSDVTPSQLDEVRKAAAWFIELRGRL